MEELPKLIDEVEEYFHIDHEEHPPIKVEVVTTPDSENESAQYVSFRTYVLAGTEPWQMVLPQSNKRARSSLKYFSTVAGAYITVGRAEQIQAGGYNVQGYRIYAGQSLDIAAEPAVFFVPDGVNAGVLSVKDELYRV